MSNDLLFSVLPREGKVPFTHDEYKVQKVSKESALRELSDKEQELHLEEKEARQQQQSRQHKQADEDAADAGQTDAGQENAADSESSDPNKPAKGFKHLDIYI